MTLLRIALTASLSLTSPAEEPTPTRADEAGPDAEPAPAAEPAGMVPVPPPMPEAVAVDPANYRLVLAGDVTLGLGGAGFIVMAAGLAVRANAQRLGDALALADEPDPVAIAEQDRKLALGTVLAIAGGASAAALIGAGIGLIAAGRVRERKRREALFALPTPAVGREGVTLTWSLRF